MVRSNKSVAQPIFNFKLRHFVLTYFAAEQRKPEQHGQVSLLFCKKTVMQETINSWSSLSHVDKLDSAFRVKECCDIFNFTILVSQFVQL